MFVFHSSLTLVLTPTLKSLSEWSHRSRGGRLVWFSLLLLRVRVSVTSVSLEVPDVPPVGSTTFFIFEWTGSKTTSGGPVKVNNVGGESPNFPGNRVEVPRSSVVGEGSFTRKSLVWEQGTWRWGSHSDPLGRGVLIVGPKVQERLCHPGEFRRRKEGNGVSVGIVLFPEEWQER